MPPWLDQTLALAAIAAALAYLLRRRRGRQGCGNCGGPKRKRGRPITTP